MFLDWWGINCTWDKDLVARMPNSSEAVGRSHNGEGTGQLIEYLLCKHFLYSVLKWFYSHLHSIREARNTPNRCVSSEYNKKHSARNLGALMPISRQIIDVVGVSIFTFSLYSNSFINSWESMWPTKWLVLILKGDHWVCEKETGMDWQTHSKGFKSKQYIGRSWVIC